MTVNSPEHNEMKKWLGSGNRLANALAREGVQSMAKLDQEYLRLGERDLTTFLGGIPNIGEGSVTQILTGLKEYRANKNGTGKPHNNTQPYDVWTRNDSPEWLARNAGCTDLRLVIGLNFHSAMTLRTLLGLQYGDENVEIHPSNQPPKPGTVGSNNQGGTA